MPGILSTDLLQNLYWQSLQDQHSMQQPTDEDTASTAASPSTSKHMLPAALVSQTPVAHAASPCGSPCAAPLHASTAVQDQLAALPGSATLDFLGLLAAHRPAQASAQQLNASHAAYPSSGSMALPVPSSALQLSSPNLRFAQQDAAFCPAGHHSSFAAPTAVNTGRLAVTSSINRASSVSLLGYCTNSCAQPGAATPNPLALTDFRARPTDGTQPQPGSPALASESSASTIREVLLRNPAALQPTAQQLPGSLFGSASTAAGLAGAAVTMMADPAQQQVPVSWQAPQPESSLHGIALPMTGSTTGGFQDSAPWGPPAHMYSASHAPLGASLTAGQQHLTARSAVAAAFPGQPLGNLSYLAQQQQVQAAAATAQYNPLLAVPSPLTMSPINQLPSPAAYASPAYAPATQQQQQQQQQQLDELLRAQQLHLLQAQAQLLTGGAAAAPGGLVPAALGLSPGAAFGAANSLGPLGPWNPAALQGAALPGLWGGPVYPALMHPAMQLQKQQQLLVVLAMQQQQQQLLAAHAAMYPYTASDRALQHSLNPHSSTAGLVFDSTGTADVQVAGHIQAAGVSPFAVQAQAAAAAAEDETGFRTWLRRWMPLPQRSNSQACDFVMGHQAPATSGGMSNHASAPMISAAATAAAAVVQAAAGDSAAQGNSSLLELAVLTACSPFSPAAGISSLMMRGGWFVGSTAASATSRAAHSAAVACIAVSQYQLLLLLCCLTMMAAAARAAAMAAAAMVDAGCTMLQLADRESRTFARAAALVAFTDMKQLCKLLATQPLLLTHGKAAHTQIAVHASGTAGTSSTLAAATDHAAAVAAGASAVAGEPEALADSGSSAASTAAALAVAPSRSLSRRLSAVLGELLTGTASRRGMFSTTNSRRTSTCNDAGTAATADTVPIAPLLSPAAAMQAAVSRRTSCSQQVTVAPDLSPAAAPAAVAGRRPVFAQAAAVVRGLSPHTLILYDSLAVISGLWAGMWLRLWMLLALQVPLASCRIWLQAVQTSCLMSASAAAASARTGMHAAWGLAQLSLMLLSAAAASTSSSSGGSGSGCKDTPAGPVLAAAAAETPVVAAGWVPLPAGAFMAVLATLQWMLLQAVKARSRVWQLAVQPVLWLLLGSATVVRLLSSLSTTAASAVLAPATALRSTFSWTPGAIKGQLTQLSFKAGMHGLAVQVLQLAGVLSVWLACRAYGLLEALAYMGVEWLLRDAPPVAHAAVYGSCRMIKGLVVEAGRQSGLLAVQLMHAWQAQGGQ